MSFLALLLLTGSAAAEPPLAPKPQATAVGVARARVIAPAEVRRIDGQLQVVTGDRKAPTQVNRTKRADGGETADFY